MSDDLSDNGNTLPPLSDFNLIPWDSKKSMVFSFVKVYKAL